jgi:hypothetical protein
MFNQTIYAKQIDFMEDIQRIDPQFMRIDDLHPTVSYAELS